ncbi:MAG: terminase large subunit [Pseudomonadota bacterium]
MRSGRPPSLTPRSLAGLSNAEKAAKYLESLVIPEGRLAGERLKLAGFQKSFLEGAYADGIDTAVLSVGRGGGKSTLTAGLALGHLVPVLDTQPRRDVLIIARSRDQAAVCFKLAEGLSRSLPEWMQAKLTIRRGNRLEMVYDECDGESFLRVVAADGKNLLGSGPTCVVEDERGSWDGPKGDAVEESVRTGLGKRDGRLFIISTSAENDAHSFSRWIDEPPEGCYVQEHRATENCQLDDVEEILAANPGCRDGIGYTEERLLKDARRALDRGGRDVTAFRLRHLNQRVSSEDLDVLIPLHEWMRCETNEPPAQEGPCVIGLDLGESASMSTFSFYWYKTGRLEVYGAFARRPALPERGARDGVKDLYEVMARSGELALIGERAVPVEGFLEKIWQRSAGYEICAIVCDRFKKEALLEAAEALRIPLGLFIFRGNGMKDGSDDVARFERAVAADQVRLKPSLMMRSAIASATVKRDDSNNRRPIKRRSTGRIDAVSAVLMAIGEGSRRFRRPVSKELSYVWG